MGARPVLTEAGDVGISGAGMQPFTLRPTLRNMAALGTPAEIVALFVTIMGPVPDGDKWGAALDARAVLWACAEGCLDDAHIALGSGVEDGDLSAPQVVALARHLLMHGVVGAVEQDSPATGEPLKEFDAAMFAALAVAHLGMSVTAAWELSMTSLVQALKAKFPALNKQQGGGGAAPSAKELEDTMAWFDAVQR